MGASHSVNPGAGGGHLRACDLQFHPSSYADSQGRVFRVGAQLCRGVTAERAAFCARLIDTGVVADLVAKKLLVSTMRSALSAEGYAMVLEHQRVSHVSYPFEWSGEMMRAAALHTLEMLATLGGHGLTLKDAHGWNVLFHGCEPVFVDFGSIVEAAPAGGWLPHVEQEFREHFLHPLELLAAGHGRITRALLRDFDQGISLAECRALLPASALALQADGQSLPWEMYKQYLAALDLRAASLGWSGYYDGEFPRLEPDEHWTPKHHAVHQLLRRFQPATVLDIGTNRGWYAMLAAKLGAQVVAFDNDEVCINQLFADARRARLAVQPLLMSYLNPAARHGGGEGVTESAAERLQSDLVLALAMVHHMVFKMNLNFEQIAAGLAAYTKRTLVVELPPSDDIHVRQWMTPRHSWYTPANFMAALSRHFAKITIEPSHPLPRVILVCER